MHITLLSPDKFVRSPTPYVRTHEWILVGYFKFPKNQLRNKPHLQKKIANKLKMRFIP